MPRSFCVLLEDGTNNVVTKTQHEIDISEHHSPKDVALGSGFRVSISTEEAPRL